LETTREAVLQLKVLLTKLKLIHGEPAQFMLYNKSPNYEMM